MDEKTGPAREAPSALAAGYEAARLAARMFGEESAGSYLVDGATANRRNAAVRLIGVVGAALLVTLAAALLVGPVGLAQAQGEATPPEGWEPWDIRVVPGDGILTVTWRVNPRDGVEDSDIRHALRWSQEPGVWANPRDPKSIGRNDGIVVEGGVTSYLITGLKNGVATGVFVRSFTGHNRVENAEGSSKWVRTKGEHTTPVGPPNSAPTVSASISDATIVNESGTRQVSLSGVFSDPDGDSLTITAISSDSGKATVSVAADQASLTVTAKSRGTATITVTADDGNGATANDTFTVTVKAAPLVALAIADVSGLTAGDSQDISLSGVFSDADGDSLTITAQSSDTARATVSVASDGSKLTASGVAEGTTTVTATAQDTDGNTVSDAFDLAVTRAAEPEAPEQKDYSKLTAEVVDGGVALSWDAPTEDADSVTGYRVAFRTQGSDRLRTWVADTGSAETSYTATGAAVRGQTYYYQVTARRGGGVQPRLQRGRRVNPRDMSDKRFHTRGDDCFRDPRSGRVHDRRLFRALRASGIGRRNSGDARLGDPGRSGHNYAH